MTRKSAPHAGETLDEIQSAADRLGAFLQANIRSLAIALVVLLLAAGLASLLVSRRRGSEEAASIALTDAREDYLEAMGAPPGSLVVPELANPEAGKRIREESAQRYAEIAEAHRGTVSGSLARLEAAALQMQAGEVEPALASLEQLRAEAPRRPGLQGVILQRVAQALEQLERFGEAAERHEEASRIEGYPLRFYALADAARCRSLAGEPDAARQLYARLDTEAPELRLPEYQRLQRRELEAGASPEAASN